MRGPVCPSTGGTRLSTWCCPSAVFDREIPASLLLGFHSSEARQVLDTFRAVKRMVHTD
jgi:hypothetical protein